jgi:PAS domain S-box-containing protein
VGVILGLVIGVLGGLINGAIFAFVRIPSFIVTLGMMVIFRAATHIISGGEAIYLSDASSGIGGYVVFDALGRFPGIFIATIVLCAIGWVVYNRTGFGDELKAIGGSERAVGLLGVRLDFRRLSVFALSGFVIGLASVINLARIGAATPVTGIGLELEAISAVVLGGTSLTGGKGSVSKTVLGAVALVTLSSGLTIAGIPPSWNDAVRGVLLLVAAGLALDRREIGVADIIGVVISNLEGAIIEANDAFLDLVGYSRDDLIAGRIRWTELTPGDWQAASQRAVAQIRATGRCDIFEKEYLHKDGRRVPVLVGGAAFDETRTESVSFVLDLTERKRTEEALQKARTELAHITRVMTMGELAASIAHELNQPLAAIVADANASLNWLARERPDLERARDGLQAIARDGHRAAEVIQRIRQLATKSASRRDSLDVNEVAREMMPLVRAELQRHDVSLRLELAPELSPVLGDRVQLQQVILNLVMNGIEAMAGNRGRPRELTIRSQPDDHQHVTVSVQDTGVGISPKDLDRMFDAFFTTKPGGMGMGLSISRSIIEAHGGRLLVTSNEPHGAIFHFLLPVAPRPLLDSIAPESRRTWP